MPRVARVDVVILAQNIHNTKWSLQSRKERIWVCSLLLNVEKQLIQRFKTTNRRFIGNFYEKILIRCAKNFDFSWSMV